MRKKTALVNLSIALGDRHDQDELTRIAKNSFRHFGKEIVRILIIDKEARKPTDQWIDLEGVEELTNRSGKGGVVVGGHLGSWDIGSFIIPRLGEEFTIYTGKHANEKADKWLNEIRSRAGTKTSSTDDDRTEIYEKCKSELVGIMGDLSPQKAPVKIKFFGRESDAAQGPALLSLLNNVDYIYFSCVVIGKRIKIRFKKITFEKTSSRKENVKRLTQAYFDTLEDDIRLYPEQYYWIHRRWKRDDDIKYEDDNAQIFGTQN